MVSLSVLIAIIFIAVAVTKTFLFQKSIGDKKFLNWFYFSRYSVIPSSKETRKSKEFQNKLSFILFAMILSELIICLVIKNFI